MRLLVTGSASSGKSAYAEKRALSLGAPHLYLATMASEGAEAQARIQRHRLQRAHLGFTTLECPRALDSLTLPPQLRTGSVLLEDLGNLVANEMWGGDISRALPGVLKVARQCASLVVVTNEVGCAGDYYAPTASLEIRSYIDALGALSCALAAEFDEVVEVVAGIPMVVKQS